MNLHETVTTAESQPERVAGIWQCAWCNRWFNQDREYVDAPTDGRVPSHGICKEDFEAQLKTIPGRNI